MATDYDSYHEQKKHEFDPTVLPEYLALQYEGMTRQQAKYMLDEAMMVAKIFTKVRLAIDEVQTLGGITRIDYRIKYKFDDLMQYRTSLSAFKSQEFYNTGIESGRHIVHQLIEHILKR